MGKNKLKKFAEMETLPNVFQCATYEVSQDDPVMALRGRWNAEVFHNDQPIVLELGCGRGDYSVGLGRLYPDKNFIGVDIKGARMWAGAKEAVQEGLQNVAFLRTNIETITRFFAPGEVSEIWITFPDPQMKKVTKRLTGTSFLKRYQEILKANGLIHLKTDSPFLYTYTREMLHLNRYPVEADIDDLYATEQEPDAQALQTYYEKQWLDRGLSIKYLRWQLTPKTEWEEPDIEIEKDSYRSFGRNYHVSATNH